MAINTGIEWTDNTWNPHHGCHKISAGCKYCYMFRDKERYGQNPDVVLRSKGKFNEPLTWKDRALVFTCSWSDFFIEEADPYRAEEWDVIRRTPHLTYQILTKRPERIKECLPPDWGPNGYPNVWLVTSVENNKVAYDRIYNLLNVPAVVHGLSMEPLLERITLNTVFPLNNRTKYINALFGYMDELGGSSRSLPYKLDWIIVGGESGNSHGKYRYRPMELEWATKIVDDCKEAGVPVFVKQLGTHLAKQLKLAERTGKDMNEFPVERLKVREFPKVFDYATRTMLQA